MKVSLNWLKDFIDIPADLSPDTLAHDLTMSTVEVEGYEDCGAQLDKIVVGKIVEIVPHPDADKLKICKTDVGASELANIICGGSNIEPEMFVAVAQSGAMVRWHGEGDLIKLKPAKIRGIESEGMICASNEIGLADLFPAKSGDEIVNLYSIQEELTLTPGAPLASALGLDDIVFDIDNKSLTNRPDLWGHYGIARELAAIYKLELRESHKPIKLPKKDAKLVKIEILNPERCDRYCGVTFTCDNTSPTPFVIRRRLAMMDQRAINLLVDLTNYVLFGVGKPIHVFDKDKLNGTTITARLAKDGEKALLLDEVEYELTSNDLVITDEGGVVAFGGIMGGLESSVTEGTTEVLLESASFEPIHTRRSGTRHGIRTESSMRFEKGIDSERVDDGIQFYLSLLKDLKSDLKITSSDDCYPIKPEVVTVTTTQEFINSRIGQELSIEEITGYLERLQFQVKGKKGTFTVTVPPWRSTGDVSIQEDIVEEVARLHGYDNIEFVPPPVQLFKSVSQKDHELRMEIRNHLSGTAGMNEVVTYPWVEDLYLEAAGFSRENCLKLHAPPSQSSQCLRSSLVPNLLFGVKQNRRNFSDFALFEIATVFKPSERDSSDDNEHLHEQVLHLGGVSAAEDREEAFFRAKGIIESFFKHLPFGELKLSPSEEPPSWAQNGSTLDIFSSLSKEPLGQLALLGEAVGVELSLKNCFVGVFEINLNALLSLKSKELRYAPLPQYPQVDYELSLLIDAGVSWGEIQGLVQGSSKLMRGVEFLDVYTGKQVPEGKKSLSLRFTLGDKNATLSSEEVNKVANKVLKKLNKSFGAELRAG